LEFTQLQYTKWSYGNNAVGVDYVDCTITGSTGEAGNCPGIDNLSKLSLKAESHG